MKQYSSNDDVLQVIEMLIELKLYVQAVLNPHFHLHFRLLLCALHIAVVVQNCKIDLLYDRRLQIPIHDRPNEIADSSCNTIESLILLLEIGELKFECFILCQDACRFKLLG